MSLSEKSMQILVAEKLTKTYGDVQALVNVTVSLDPGIWGIIGPNGAGKTTLLNLVWGLQYPTSGSLTVLGIQPTQDDFNLKKQLGVSFTAQHLPFGYTCYEYLLLVAEAYGYSPQAIKPLVYRLMNTLELDSALNRNVTDLSSGMKQKVTIIQSLLGLPHLAILDEPFANLDPHIKLYVRNLFVQFYQELGTNFLISSHSLDDLASFCTHYLFIDKGQVVWNGLSTAIPKNEMLDFYMKITGKE
ncbi:MAG: ABC transporter ATP-binding protein [Candidatus Hermodarchaeota archaeon]